MGYLAELLLNETSVEDLKKQWVDSKKISPEQFDTICKAANNKSSWVTWFGKRILDRQLSLKPEDVSKWQEIINLFERYKQRFTYKDINQVKTRDQISQFVDQALDLKSQAQSKDVATKAAKDQFSEFYKGTVTVDGKTFKVYVLPKGHPENYEVSRALAGDTHWCTASSGRTMYDYYIKSGDLVMFLNTNNPDEKYQMHLQSGSIMNKADRVPKGEEANTVWKLISETALKGWYPVTEGGLGRTLFKVCTPGQLEALKTKYQDQIKVQEKTGWQDTITILQKDEPLGTRQDIENLLLRYFGHPVDLKLEDYREQAGMEGYDLDDPFIYGVVGDPIIFVHKRVPGKVLMLDWNGWEEDIVIITEFDEDGEIGMYVDGFNDKDILKMMVDIYGLQSDDLEALQQSMGVFEDIDMSNIEKSTPKGEVVNMYVRDLLQSKQVNESFNPDQKARLQYLAGITKD